MVGARKWLKGYQRQALRVLSSPVGFFCVVAVSIGNACILFFALSHVLQGAQCRGACDNIGGVDLSRFLTYEPFDAVYTWVNGSDPIWLASKDSYLKDLEPLPASDLRGPLSGARLLEYSTRCLEA